MPREAEGRVGFWSTAKSFNPRQERGMGQLFCKLMELLVPITTMVMLASYDLVNIVQLL